YQALHDVRSERFYKERAKGEGIITYYINLGLKDWPETRAALLEEQDRASRRGLRVDHVSLTADRRMGLATAHRTPPTAEWVSHPMIARRRSRRPGSCSGRRPTGPAPAPRSTSRASS